MLFNFQNLKDKFNLSINGIIHIGAHYGEEIDTYKSNCINDIICFEPLLSNFHILENLAANKAELFNLALGNDNKKISMYVEEANNGQSSSILKPDVHLQQYPHIIFNKEILVDMIKLDDFMICYKADCKNKNKKFNMINIDVQGYELEVFKGAKNTLKNIDYIMSEVNRDYLYKGCALVQEVDEFLSSFGFERSETFWAGGTWGDALYIKK